nr:MAG TPA: hypothetical protein [Bacteriophage sp.]
MTMIIVNHHSLMLIVIIHCYCKSKSIKRE